VSELHSRSNGILLRGGRGARSHQLDSAAGKRQHGSKVDGVGNLITLRRGQTHTDGDRLFAGDDLLPIIRPENIHPIAFHANARGMVNWTASRRPTALVPGKLLHQRRRETAEPLPNRLRPRGSLAGSLVFPAWLAITFSDAQRDA
jgi:hypothetical protein